MTEDEVYSYIRRFLTARHDKLYTQAQLAQRAHITQAMLARFELCRANPTLKFLHNLAEALEMEMLGNQNSGEKTYYWTNEGL